MPTSQRIADSYSSLREALERLLVHQAPSLHIPSDVGYPVLVLETHSDVAVFATLDGSPEDSYSKAYATFKALYRSNHDKWQERTLSFVLCRHELRSSDDEFFSKTETDVYFCRKYVIALLSEESEQLRQLQRLPFLPLPDDQAGGVTRPPSARAILQSANLSATLAAQIVVDYESTAGNTLNAVLSNLAEREGIPTDLAVERKARPEVLQRSLAVDNTRVSGISIEAFRAYRKRQEFDLDADLVVLYGPNGLGKTSFFDAIDYVCTGRIGRFCHRRIKADRFFGLARHLDSSPEDGSVCLRVRRGEVTSTVTRDLMNWSNARILVMREYKTGRSVAGPVYFG